MTSSARDRIVEAAIKLFWTTGYNAVSTGAICKLAGVNKSSLYHFFPSKAHILDEALEGVWARNRAEIAAIYAGDASIEERFHDHLAWFHDSQRQLELEYGYALGTFDMALGVATPEAVQLKMKEHEQVHAALIEDAVHAMIGGQPAQVAAANWMAEIVSNIIVGATVRARVRNDLAALRELPQTVFAFLAHAQDSTSKHPKHDPPTDPVCT
jgi:TetR/AcrR family transcriptional repressor of nem operon